MSENDWAGVVDERGKGWDPLRAEGVWGMVDSFLFSGVSDGEGDICIS